MTRALLTLAVMLVLASGCAGGTVAGDVYRQGPVAFRFGNLPDGWQRAGAGDALAFHHRHGGTIGAHVTCDRSEDVSLDVLTNHLLIGLDPRRELGRQKLTLDGRAALRTRVDAALDGVPVALALVVVKKDGCVYDLTLVAARETFAARAADFDRFLGGFAVGVR